jgi:glycosyltransferase involved in cell wall biosynthesis
MLARRDILLSLTGPFGQGGLADVVRNLQSALAEFRIELQWLGCGARTAEFAQRQARSEDWQCGEIVGAALEDEKTIAEEYRKAIIERRPAAVLFHMLTGPVETNLAAYLPREILRIAMVHSITPATYRAARGMRNYFHAAIGVSPRICEDLVKLCGFPAGAVFCAPNGVDYGRFAAQQRVDREDGPLRILSCGRIEDIAKGVFWIPEIVAKARALGVDVTLTVAGDGPDRAELEKRVGRLGLQECTQFRGWVHSQDLPRLYAEHDVFLFPSRFEGLPLALVEAMAAGCVPVATKIRGVTDFVVQDGHTGILFSSGEVNAAARSLRRLGGDRRQLIAMRKACREKSFERFDIREQARILVEVLKRVKAEPRSIKDPLPIERWSIMRGLRPAWWSSLPEPVKNHLRVLRERGRVLS